MTQNLLASNQRSAYCLITGLLDTDCSSCSIRNSHLGNSHWRDAKLRLLVAPFTSIQFSASLFLRLSVRNMPRTAGYAVILAGFVYILQFWSDCLKDCMRFCVYLEHNALNISLILWSFEQTLQKKATCTSILCSAPLNREPCGCEAIT
jgi:hypothetical protein